MRSTGNVQNEDALLQQAILQTLVYADLFDYPLTPHEVVRYLGVAAEPAAIVAQLNRSAASGVVMRHNGYVALPGRAELFDLRARREQTAARQWPAARRYARWLALVPFVRMVAVTGTLAVNNVEPADDIDLFIITQPGRLWLCRAWVVALVRLAALAGDELCPNYFLSEQHLAFDDHSLFTAREVTQMAPLYGADVYWRIRQINRWVEDFLPQAGDQPQINHQRGRGQQTWIEPGPLERAVKRTAEALLGGALGARLERWEMERKVRKFNAIAQSRGGSVAFTADCCKGHFGHHDQRIQREFEAELAHHGLRST